MASDPYHNFAAELRSSLAATRQLTQRYEGLSRRGAGGGGGGDEVELRSTYAQLQESIEALENDIGDVRESVQMVEVRGPERFGVDPAELARRKTFVRDCEKEMQTLTASFRKARQARTAAAAASGGVSDDEDEDATLAFEMEQQEHLLSQQDNTLSLIGNTLTNLQRQAGTLGREIGEQVDLIGALDSEVDASQNKLTRAMGRMDELARRADDRMGGWCVWILILALMVFALVAILI